MFGSTAWKDTAKEWERIAGERADEINGLRVENARLDGGWEGSHNLGVSTLKLLQSTSDELRQAKGQLSAADLQLAAERQDNARLRPEVAKLESMNERIEERLTKKAASIQTELETARANLLEMEGVRDAAYGACNKLAAQLDHAQHCYEQCEIDRQAIAKERDGWKADRDGLAGNLARIAEGGIEQLAVLRDVIAKLSGVMYIEDPCSPSKAENKADASPDHPVLSRVCRDCPSPCQDCDSDFDRQDG